MISGRTLALDAGRTLSTDLSASLHRSPDWGLFLASGLPRLICSCAVLVLRPFRVSCGWPPHGYNDSSGWAVWGGCYRAPPFEAFFASKRPVLAPARHFEYALCIILLSLFISFCTNQPVPGGCALRTPLLKFFCKLCRRPIRKRQNPKDPNSSDPIYIRLLA